MEDSRLSTLLQYLVDQPKDAFLLFAIAKEYETQDKLDKALNYYLKLKENHPDYIGLYLHLGMLYESIQEVNLALQIYSDGIDLAKKIGDFHALSELNNAKTNLEIQLGN